MPVLRSTKLLRMLKSYEKTECITENQITNQERPITGRGRYTAPKLAGCIRNT